MNGSRSVRYGCRTGQRAGVCDDQRRPVDKPFLDKYCVGYDETTMPAGAPANGHYKAYILGEGPDGVAKPRVGS